MRREELCTLKVKDTQSRQGVIHFKVKGKRGKIRFVPAHAQAQRLIESYLLMAGHGDDHDGALFRPVRNNRTGEMERPLNTNSLYRIVVRKYGQATGLNIEVNGLCVHSMRATAATNALSHEADIAKVQEWLGQRLHHPPLRPTENAARRLPDLSGAVLGQRHIVFLLSLILPNFRN